MATRTNNTAARQARLKGEHLASWFIKGRGKSAQYFAALPPQEGNKGERIKLLAKSGNVTTGTLVELQGINGEGFEFWTFDRDAKTPEEKAADRARNIQARANYWSSEKGVETARKIEERNAKRQSEQVETPVQETTVQQATTPSSTPDLPTMIAALIAAGMSPTDAAVKAVDTINALTTTPAPTATVPAKVKGTRVRKAAASTTTTEATSTTKSGGCVSCGKSTTDLHKHIGAGVDGVCGKCMLLDGDTVRGKVVARNIKGA